MAFGIGTLAKKTLKEAAKHVDDLKGIDPTTKKALTVEKKKGRKQTEAAIKGTATNRSTARKSAVTGAAGGAGLASASSKDSSESTRDKNTAKSSKTKDPYSGGVDALMQKALSKNKESKEDKKGMSEFEKAFDAARKEGKDTFKFKNKKGETDTYTTELKKNNKGGYMKKARTGTMDYRKGGLFK